MTVANDFAALSDRLRRMPEHANESLRTLFDRQSPIFIARAPGRLDIMGGIGDYSGSLVLELPIAEAAFAAVQRSSTADVAIVSLRGSAGMQSTSVTIPERQWHDLRSGDYAAARQYFARDASSAWASYVAGPVLVLLRETQAKFDGGLRILIDSNVPEGKGVSSSAAVEVATMRAVAALFNFNLQAEELARLCQLAENHVVGAPCGIMDQMTSALGRKNELLALRCQPAIVEGFVPIPADVAFWAIDSGVRHSIGGSDYSSVRCGAFMGYRIIADKVGFSATASAAAPHVVDVHDPQWNGYLANITPHEFQTKFAAAILEQMVGREFLNRYGGTTDRVTRVDPARTYSVRAATLHPIEENERAQQFRALLEGPINDQALSEMGQLMFATHASYTACGLASPATDLLVNLVRESGPATGLFGAKITGGGSGGAVAILAHAESDDAVVAIARRYSEITARETYIFRGSSPGAYSTAVQEFVI